MPRDTPGSNGDWDSHRMHVIAELKRAVIERDSQSRQTSKQHKEVCSMIGDLKTEMAVQRTRLDLRSSLFGISGGGVLIAFVEFIKLIVSQGGK
jgi:site-specific recombinase